MKNFFYGWYLKCQSNTKTLAVIPAIHKTGHAKTCSIQIITDDNTWNIIFPIEEFKKKKQEIYIEKNQFTRQGMQLEINKPEFNLIVKGKIKFGSLFPLKYDIMGPFAFVPFMECRHSVWSMKHSVDGIIHINGEEYVFNNSYGYWEGDRGYSFPKEYVWTQCLFEKGSLMLSVANIPIGIFHFTGIIGVVLWQGKEYRLATYLGAKVEFLGDRTVWITQGKFKLEAIMLEENGKALKAPTKGDMTRTIHENIACKAFYRFWKEGEILFEFETSRASFEYEYLI